MLIFLEASDEVLARRYSETRRPHPMAKDRPVLDAIREERAALTEVKSLADMVLDTSAFSVHELKAEVMRRFDMPGERLQMLVTIISFGLSTACRTTSTCCSTCASCRTRTARAASKTGLDRSHQYLRAQPGDDSSTSGLVRTSFAIREGDEELSHDRHRLHRRQTPLRRDRPAGRISERRATTSRSCTDHKNSWRLAVGGWRRKPPSISRQPSTANRQHNCTSIRLLGFAFSARRSRMPSR
jgi:hypothetical protein